MFIDNLDIGIYEMVFLRNDVITSQFILTGDNNIGPFLFTWFWLANKHWRHTCCNNKNTPTNQQWNKYLNRKHAVWYDQSNLSFLKCTHTDDPANSFGRHWSGFHNRWRKTIKQKYRAPGLSLQYRPMIHSLHCCPSMYTTSLISQKYFYPQSYFIL